MTAAAPPSARLAPAPDTQPWRKQFPFDHVKVLIVCRGPIRLEALQAFAAVGAQPSGILLSEKDSVVYPRALAPELRLLGRREGVHRVPDYAGATAEEKARAIARILEIAHRSRYTHVFAGYGFMAEDHEFIQAVEGAGLGFVGPSSAVVCRAGAKDAAKRLARQMGVSVTPGLDEVLAVALLSQAPGTSPERQREFLAGLARRHGLSFPMAGASAGQVAPNLQAEAQALLEAAQARRVELVTLAQLQAETELQLRSLLKQYPGRRFRLKHVGGGGGKGQRILAAPEQASQAVIEVLTEARALGPGDNRNFLIELNVESTRHNEIQLLGNGRWCLALGGRDCSLQMHEQKLLEVSITQEQLAAAAHAYHAQGRTEQARVLEQDLALLREMEQQAQRFGEAVGLNSASTFESIVEGPHHYFMEVNTRIQVEHRVTEMVYGLRLHARQGAPIPVDSLVEAMLWLAVHGPAIERAERVPRHGSGAEARINATNEALQPHAGGVVQQWSPPAPDELRDDQGIGVRNPDTDSFMPYRLAGAYDSNAALVVTHGKDRRENFQRLAEILRCTELEGEDVQTNLGFHRGLLLWMLSADAHVKPSTRFVRAYLAAVGQLRLQSLQVDLDEAWGELERRADGAAQAVLAAKQTLIVRPVRLLLERPHALAGWLARGIFAQSDAPWEVRRPAPPASSAGDPRAARWRINPLQVLDELYLHLRLEERPHHSAEQQIWDHDRDLLREGLAFYAALERRWTPSASPPAAASAPAFATKDGDWARLAALLEAPHPPTELRQGSVPALGPAGWAAVQAAHRGHQAGLELLMLPILIGQEAGFDRLRVTERLEVEFPAEWEDTLRQAPALAALAPPPPASSNQIVAWTGGTFYARPTPQAEPYVRAGQHVQPGDVVGLLEVMKMFNPLRADFAGTLTRVLTPVEGGVVVQKGQPLFEISPDTPPVQVDPEQAQRLRLERTRSLMQRC